MWFRRAALGFWLVSLALIAGCSDGSGGAKHTHALDAGPADATDATATDATSAPDTASDADAQCPGVAACPPGQRMVACKCYSDLDRRCVSDSDCRDGESCEHFDKRDVCMYHPKPVRVCPGSDGCDAGGDGVFYAGAASRVINLQGFETPTAQGVDEHNLLSFNPGQVSDEVWHDCGYDGLCPGDDGYPGPDEGEGDGKMQGMWLAGFSSGRPAQFCPAEKIGCDGPDCCVSKYAHDNLKVQVAAMRYNDVTVVFASVDSIGWFHSDLAEVRRRVAQQADVDLLIMAGTHDHEAPDTAGQWGPGNPAPVQTGRDPKFIENIYRKSTEAIVEAVGNMQPAEAQTTVLDVGVHGLALNDSRTPYIINDDVPVLRLVSKDTGDTIATMLSLGNHAEVLWSENPYITADYPHFVRKYITEGLDAVTDANGNQLKPALPGLGGVTVFFAGSVGGLVTPGPGGALDYADHAPADNHSYEAADAVGQRLASHVLGAVKDGKLETLDAPDLRFADKEFLSPIKNKRFQLAAYVLHVLDRNIYNASPLTPTTYVPDVPEVLTETAVVRLGELSLFSAPGEVFPETLTGGFPGKPSTHAPVIGDAEERRTPAVCDADGLPTDDPSADHACIVKPDQENPPDWTATPDGPYVYDWVPGKYQFFIGLGMDFLGYFVPSYDYKIDNFMSAAPGDHYEETNGIGPDIVNDWKTALRTCIEQVQ